MATIVEQMSNAGHLMEAMNLLERAHNASDGVVANYEKAEALAAMAQVHLAMATAGVHHGQLPDTGRR